MGKDETIIEISLDGSCISVWEDDTPLNELGLLKVTRLADVDYVNEQQGWVVTFRNGVTLPKVFSGRAEALKAETQYVDNNLEEFGKWAKSQEKLDGRS